MNKSLIVNYINKFLAIGYYLLFLLTPLIMLSITSELFEFNKIIFIYLITSLIFFFWLLKIIIVKKIDFKKNLFIFLFLIFLISQLLSTFFSIDRHTSLFGYYGRFNGGLISILCYFILFYIFINNYDDFNKNFLEIFLKINLFSSFLVILWGLPGKFGLDLTCFIFTKQLNNSCWTDQFRPSERVFSTLGQPNWLGAYLLINFFIGLYFYFKKKEKINFFYLIYLFLNFSTILFTRSRSSLLAFFICFSLFLIFKFFVGVKNHYFIENKKSISLIFVLILSLFIWKTGIDLVDKIISLRFLTETNKKKLLDRDLKSKKSEKKILLSTSVTDSAEIRKIVWKGAVNLGKKYPWFGTGVETFGYSYYFVRPKEHNLTSEWDYLYNKAHNEYLNYLATTGFIGLGSYLLMIFFIIFIGIKKIFLLSKSNSLLNKNSNFDFQINNNILLIICLLLAYFSILITNFFGFSTTTINLFFYLIPAFFIVVNEDFFKNNGAKEFDLQDNKITFSQRIMIFILLFVICYLLFVISKYWLADVYYAKGNIYNQAGQYQLSVKEFEKALKLHYEHVYEDKLSYALANLAFVAFYQNEDNISKKLIKLADFYNKKSLSVSPKNILYWKTRAKNCYIFYQIDNNINWLKEGIYALEQAKRLSPTDPKIFYNLALYYSLFFDEEKENSRLINQSLNSINQAIILKPDFRDGYFLKGQLLKKIGKKNEAKKVFDYVLENLNPQDKEVKKEIEKLN